MRPSERWGLTIIISAAVVGMALLMVATEGVTEVAIRRVVRATARCSAILFFVTFATPGLATLNRRGLGMWLETNSPFLFLSFTASHLVHLMTLITWATLFPGPKVLPNMRTRNVA